MRVIRKILLVAFWVGAVGGLLTALAFTSTMEESQPCKKVQVSVYPFDLHFYNRQRVLEKVRKTLPDGMKLIGTPFSEIKANQLEAQLRKDPLLEDAEAVTDLNGTLTLSVHQRRPVLRVLRFDGTEFYLDQYGVKMPLSDHFTAPVPLANGNIFERLERGDTVYSFVGNQLFKIASYVDKDEFLKALIEQIFVRADNELVLVPRIGCRAIIFGDANLLEKKFRKLLVFYREGLNRTGWNRYSSIDLRFEGQVVCKR